MRHTAPETLPHLNNYRLTEIEVDLQRVVDCTEPDLMNLTAEDLVGDSSYRITQCLGDAVSASGCEAARVPSASLLGENLIIFPRNLTGQSNLKVVRSRDPRLRIVP